MTAIDSHGTLLEQSRPNGSPRTAKRLVRGVAIAIGIVLCSASPAGMAQPLPKLTPYKYAYFQIGKTEANCLFKIAKKESNINYKAYNRLGDAYGAWQIKNKRVKHMSPNKQVELAIRYSNHRYGSACKAWQVWKVKRWW